MTLPLRAEQMKELGPWQVHYSAFNSSFPSPRVAKAYGLERSRYNGIVNIAVQNKRGGSGGGDQREAKNLTGTIPYPELPGGEGGGFHLLPGGVALPERGHLPVHPEDHGGGQQQTLTFQQTFYVD